MTKQRANHGFTLVEVIITLIVISILSAYGIPNYRAFKQNQSMTQAVNRLSRTINYARNQSIISGEHVILCASQSMLACDGSSLWHQGWIVFTDNNQNRVYDETDRMLLNENKMTDGIKAIASVNRPIIRYNRAGFAPGTNLSIRFCDDRGADYGKAIIISNVGRPRISQESDHCG